MPSRVGILAIVVFWLLSTSWLVVREVMPRLQTGVAPAFFTDVTAEVGGTTIAWNIFHNGKNVGIGSSQVKRHHDRTFDLSSTLIFDNFKVAVATIKKFTGRYRVDKEGNLQDLALEGKVLVAGIEVQAEVKGTVRGGLLYPELFLNGARSDLFQLKPVPVGAHGNVLNTMHLVDKVPGLRAGQTWQVPLLDPLEAIMPGHNPAPTLLLAEVHAAELEWRKAAVSCFRIDYAEPGKKVIAHTWVRQEDGLVLQQEAKQQDMDLVLVREVNK